MSVRIPIVTDFLEKENRRGIHTFRKIKLFFSLLTETKVGSSVVTGYMTVRD